MYCKEKWRTAGGKDPLLGRVDGFQIDPKIQILKQIVRYNCTTQAEKCNIQNFRIVEYIKVERSGSNPLYIPKLWLNYLLAL